MKLLKEEFDAHVEYLESWSKDYNSNNQVVSEYNRNKKSDFQYDSKGKILSETYKTHLGHEVFYEFFRSEYSYENLAFRKFTYKIGYTKFRDENNYDFDFDPPKYIEPPIYPLNELVEIEEITYFSNQKIRTHKTSDYISNFTHEKRFQYDKSEKLDCEIILENGEKVKEKKYIYSEETDEYKTIEINLKEGLESVSEFNSNFEEITRTYFKLIDDEKEVISTISINHLDAEKKVSVQNPFSVIDFNCNSLLNLPHWLYYPDFFDYFDNKVFNFEIKFIYLNDAIREIQVYDSTKHQLLERRYFLYEYLLNNGNQIIKYISGIKVTEDKIEHIFSHSFKYQD